MKADTQEILSKLSDDPSFMVRKMNDTINELNEFIKDNTRTYDGSRLFCANVKRYNDYHDIEELCEEMVLSDTETKKVIDGFTDSMVNDIHWNWLEVERDYLHTGWMEGCSYSKKDKEYEMLVHINKVTAGFCGRSGGWYAVCDDNQIFECIDNISCEIMNIESNEFYGTMIELDSLIHEAKHTIKCIKWCVDRIEEMNNNMSFKDELVYRIEEYLNEPRNDVSKP